MVNETENSTQSDFNGTFYKDYAAVKQKVTPPLDNSKSNPATSGWSDPQTFTFL